MRSRQGARVSDAFTRIALGLAAAAVVVARLAAAPPDVAPASADVAIVTAVVETSAKAAGDASGEARALGSAESTPAFETRPPGEHRAAPPAPRSDAAAAAETGPVPQRPLGFGPDRRDAHRTRPPQLDPLEPEPGAVTAAVTGRASGAGRRLTLWRVEAGAAAPLAQTRSNADGRFRFPQVALAPGTWSVTEGAGNAPGSGAALVVAAAQVAAPRPVQVVADSGGWRVRVAPAAAGGVVRVADGGGRELARIPVREAPATPHRMVSFVVDVPPDGAQLRVAQELADGRTSDWQPLVLGPPHGP